MICFIIQTPLAEEPAYVGVSNANYVRDLLSS